MKKKNAFDGKIDAIIKDVHDCLANPAGRFQGDIIDEAIRKAAEVAYVDGFEDGQSNPIANIDPDADEMKWIVALKTPAGLNLELAKHATKAAAEKDAGYMRLALKPKLRPHLNVIPADQADDVKI